MRKVLLWVALFTAACALLTYCDRKPDVRSRLARIERECTSHGERMYTWQEVDTDGQEQVYARCAPLASTDRQLGA